MRDPLARSSAALFLGFAIIMSRFVALPPPWRILTSAICPGFGRIRRNV